MAMFFGSGGTSMRLAGYEGHEEADSTEDRLSTNVVPPSPTKPHDISSPVKPTLSKAPQSKQIVGEYPQPIAQANVTVQKTEALSKTSTIVANVDVAVPNHAVAAKALVAKSTQAPSPTKLLEAEKSPIIGHNSDFHGNQFGSLSLSEKISTSKDQLHSSGKVTSLSLSKLLTDSKEKLSYDPNPNQQVISPEVTKTSDFKGNQFGSLSLSKKLTDSKEQLAYSANLPEIEQILKLIQSRRGDQIADNTSVDLLMKAIAVENGWTDDEVNEDLVTLKKYRFKTVKNLRSVSGHAWTEMKDLLPITKDFIRKSVGWAED
ncbi:UNVERIFIED_CONTAM: hypothetical protein HDU68_011681 [Siphonaria sp. JEL0065]|nr:hypothetical protein HDU68_011681 [Siphonaria sp. JEL0065]